VRVVRTTATYRTGGPGAATTCSYAGLPLQAGTRLRMASARLISVAWNRNVSLHLVPQDLPIDGGWRTYATLQLQTGGICIASKVLRSANDHAVFYGDIVLEAPLTRLIAIVDTTILTSDLIEIAAGIV